MGSSEGLGQPLPGPTWKELQSDLWLIATCAGLGGTWERLCCRPRTAVHSLFNMHTKFSLKF